MGLDRPFRALDSFGALFPGRCPGLDWIAPFGAEESRTLAELRDALLPRLLSGELRVPAKALAQAVVPAAYPKAAHQ